MQLLRQTRLRAEQCTANIITQQIDDDDDDDDDVILILTRSVAAGFGQHGMPPPASNDTGTALGQDGSD